MDQINDGAIAFPRFQGGDEEEEEEEEGNAGQNEVADARANARARALDGDQQVLKQLLLGDSLDSLQMFFAPARSRPG
jgi:hypothetical protein